MNTYHVTMNGKKELDKVVIYSEHEACKKELLNALIHARYALYLQLIDRHNGGLDAIGKSKSIKHIDEVIEKYE